ncbi:MAG: response regulator transcription factor [Polyangia bacterium]
MPITLLIADDHFLVRQGLKALLSASGDLQILGEADRGELAVQMAQTLQPDVLILDLAMPGPSGLDVAQTLTERGARCRILMLSMHDDESHVLAALQAGALGYILKSSDAAELLQAIRVVASGQRYLGQPLNDRVIAAYAKQARGPALDPYETLSQREREILKLVAEGNSNMEIAARLALSPRTVENHRASVMRKLDLASPTALIRYAIRTGLIPLSE